MSKIKICYKRDQILVKSKLEKIEKISEREVQVLQAKMIRGLMRVVLNGNRKIDYSAPNGISLQKYLSGGISKNEFFLVLAQINEVIKKIEYNGFSIDNLVMNMKYVFINEQTKEIHFIYQPVIGGKMMANVFQFFHDVVCTTVFSESQSAKCVSEVVNFISRLQCFSTTEMEKFILKIYPEVYKQIRRYKPGQSQVLYEKEWQKNNFEDEENTMLLIDEEGTTLLEDEEGTSLLDDGNEEATTLLGYENKRYPYLIRVNDFEQVDIDKQVFRIGKEKSQVDYFVMNNNAISRIHADIITQNGVYYIKDNNSTNKTFVNGIVVVPSQNIELADGDRITLANEEFEFHIE